MTETLVKTLGTNTTATVAKIVKVWNTANDEIIESGTNWYSEAESIVISLSEESGYSKEHVAAVIAHLSPRTTWKRNIEGAIALILNGKKGNGIMSSNFNRALNALNSNDPIATLNGPKTKRFALNILGDRNAVTVDVWAMRVALSGIEYKDSDLGRVGVYDAIENAYRIAAKRFNVDASTMQAVTWVMIRNVRSE